FLKIGLSFFFICKDKILFFREISGITRLKGFQFPGVEIGEVFSIPFPPPQIKKYFYFLPLIIRIQQATSVLRKLEFDQLHIIVVIHFQYKGPCTEGLSL